MHHTFSAGQIKEAALAKGLKIPDLLRAASIAPSIWSKWQAGKSGISLSTYDKLIAALGEHNENVG